MKKFVALLLTISMLITANTFVFADSTETSIGNDNYKQQQEQKEEQVVTFLSVADPSITKGDTIKIIVGLKKGTKLTNAKLTVENTDLNKEFDIAGTATDDGNMLFESDKLDSGCYSVRSIKSDEYSVDFAGIGIEAKFGVDTVVTDLNADAYAVDSSEDANAEKDSSAVVVNPDGSTSRISGGTIGEAIEAASDGVLQSDMYRSGRKINIVLDPGHGGKDSGATASFGGRTFIEKNLNLKIALYCKEELEKYKGSCNVYMTRSDDRFIELEDRVKFAKEHGATVFVCIHNNSSSSASVHGATVYYPNSNYNPQVGAEGGALAKEVLKQLVSLGLANDGTRIRNSECGDTYEDGSLCDYYSVIRNSKKSGFPGIIIEHAYLSNQGDAFNYLGSDAALRRLGVADAQGLINYYHLTQIDYSPIFDANYYLNKYSDLKAAFGNNKQAALNHFINCGMSEGRQGNDIFDVHFYKDNDVDLQKAFGNDWSAYYMHYLECGIGEGRQASAKFDVISYKTRYPDLQKAFGNDYKSYIEHYINNGRAEHRDATPLKYNVNFVSDGKVVNTQSVLCQRSAVAPDLSKAGYALSWDKPFNKITSNITITAKWSPASYTVTYDAMGGKTKKSGKQVVYQEKYGELETPVRDGYTFNGWWTAKKGGNQINKDTNVSITSNQIIYAHWNANKYNIKYNANGGTVKSNENTVIFGAKYGDLPTPQRSGYIFTGWWTAVDGGTKIDSNTIVSKASNHTLYAHWQAKGVTISYKAHVQNIGWQQAVSNGKMAGTVGRGLQIEALNIKISTKEDLGLMYSTHVQDYGWMNNSFNGQISGTTGQNKRVEAVMLKLTGSDASKYDIYYRVHSQNIGWLGWAKNGQPAGTAGLSYRVEAIQIEVVPKGDTAPSASHDGYNQNDARTFIQKSGSKPSLNTNISVEYQTHVQDIGWQNVKKNGQLSGTTGKALRLEGVKIKLNNQPYSGGIKYSTHVQNVGWQNDVSNGQLSGTTGKALRLEAMKISLTGEVAKHYDVYYRVHAQDYGWLGWAKNGEAAGTAGKSLRLEGMQIVLVKKGAGAPKNSYNGVVSNKDKAFY